jgi:hypothetical protein
VIYLAPNPTPSECYIRGNSLAPQTEYNVNSGLELSLVEQSLPVDRDCLRAGAFLGLRPAQRKALLRKRCREVP